MPRAAARRPADRPRDPRGTSRPRRSRLSGRFERRDVEQRVALVRTSGMRSFARSAVRRLARGSTGTEVSPSGSAIVPSLLAPSWMRRAELHAASTGCPVSGARTQTAATRDHRHVDARRGLRRPWAAASRARASPRATPLACPARIAHLLEAQRFARFVDDERDAAAVAAVLAQRALGRSDRVRSPPVRRRLVAMLVDARGRPAVARICGRLVAVERPRCAGRSRGSRALDAPPRRTCARAGLASEPAGEPGNERLRSRRSGR